MLFQSGTLRADTLPEILNKAYSLALLVNDTERELRTIEGIAYIVKAVRFELTDRIKMGHAYSCPYVLTYDVLRKL